jgi:hypothetical protein
LARLTRTRWIGAALIADVAAYRLTGSAVSGGTAVFVTCFALIPFIAKR